MEREGAVAVEHGLLQATLGENGPGVAEPAANRVRAVEGFHRPAVRADAADAGRVRASRRVGHWLTVTPIRVGRPNAESPVFNWRTTGYTSELIPSRRFYS